MRIIAFIFCVVTLASGFGLSLYNCALAQNGDVQSKVLAGIKNDVDIDGDNIPDRISLVKSKIGNVYNITSFLSGFKRQVVLSSVDSDHILDVHIHIMNKRNNLNYLMKNKWISDHEKRFILESKSSNFIDIFYDESSAYIVLIDNLGNPVEIYYSD